MMKMQKKNQQHCQLLSVIFQDMWHYGKGHFDPQKCGCWKISHPKHQETQRDVQLSNAISGMLSELHWRDVLVTTSSIKEIHWLCDHEAKGNLYVFSGGAINYCETIIISINITNILWRANNLWHYFSDYIGRLKIHTKVHFKTNRRLINALSYPRY